MKLTPIGIAALRGIPGLMQKIADSEGVTLRTVQRWVADHNDPLTKAATVKIIKEATGLTEEQILEESAKVETISQ